MSVKFDEFLKGVNMYTESKTKEDIAGEVSALKLAVALIFKRLTKESQNELLIEMRQLNVATLNKVANELAQFKTK